VGLVRYTDSMQIALAYFHFFNKDSNLKANRSGRAVSGMNCVRSLEHWDLGFESHSGYGCMCAFILCLCCSVCR
jgi:hypothetical protein